MTDADLTLVRRIRATLQQAGNVDRAVRQQRYMKSAMPFHGISSPELSRLLRPLLSGYRPASRQRWEATVRALWDGAAAREERYAAIAITKHDAARGWVDVDALPLLRHLVVTGAWWDYVDDLAANVAGSALVQDRARVEPVLRGWATDEDLWVRRTTVLCQLNVRDTDLALLRHVVESNVDDSSFWLRKAIGWALREQAKRDPDWVRAEVARLDGRIAALSRREALKHIA